MSNPPSAAVAASLPAAQAERLLTYTQVEDTIQFDKVTIWRMTKRGDFPAPLRIAGRARWRASDVEAWIARQVSAA